MWIVQSNSEICPNPTFTLNGRRGEAKTAGIAPLLKVKPSHTVPHTHIIMKESLTQNWPDLTMMEGTDGFLKVNWWQAPIRFQRQCECPVGMPDNLSKIRHIILPPRSVSLPQRKWLYAAGNYPKMTMRKGSAEIGEALRQARRHLANSGKESQITTKSWLSSSSQSRPWSRTRNTWGPIWLIHSPILFTCY